MHRFAITLRTPVWLTTTLVMQVIVGLITVVPALDVLLSPRDLTRDDYIYTLGGTPPLMTVGTALVMVLAVLAAILSVAEGRRQTFGSIVLLGYVFFVTTNVLLCVPFAERPWISRSHFYPPILFMALYLCRDDGAEDMIDTVKWCLLIVLVTSLVCIFAMPQLVRRVYAPEVRLPFIDFRFWGLASHANSLGPLGVLLALLTMNRPFESKRLNRLSYFSSFLCIVLAQSQTGWVMALVILPACRLYRKYGDSLRRSALLRSPIVVIPSVLLTIAILFTIVADLAEPDAAAGTIDGFRPLAQGDLLTGRTEAWQAALDTFRKNPFFGYGLLAWEVEFREQIQIAWAVHAHNQLLQSLSVAGLFGALGLITYASVLAKSSWENARASAGLAPSLLAIILIRSFTEIPLDSTAVLLNDTVIHMLLFRLLTAPKSRYAAALNPRRS